MEKKKLGRPKKEIPTHKICKDCKRKKKQAEFYAPNYPRCKKCHSNIVMEHQRENADYYNAYRNQYAKDNPDKRRAWENAFKDRWESETGMKWSHYLNEQQKERMKDDKYARKKNITPKNTDLRERKK